MEKTETLKIVVTMDVKYEPGMDVNTLLANISDDFEGMGVFRNGNILESSSGKGTFIVNNGKLFGVLDENNHLSVLLTDSRFIKKTKKN